MTVQAEGLPCPFMVQDLLMQKQEGGANATVSNVKCQGNLTDLWLRLSNFHNKTITCASNNRIKWVSNLHIMGLFRPYIHTE